MKNIIITISLLALVLSGCDRSGIFEKFVKATPYEFHVIAVSDDNNTVPVEGATVFLYQEAADRDNNKNMTLQKVAGNDGTVIFQPEDLRKEKGFFYLGLEKVVSSNLHISQAADSRYLLINDGHTHQWVKLTETMVKIEIDDDLVRTVIETDIDPETGDEIEMEVEEDVDFLGGTVYFFANQSDRDQRNLAAAMSGLTRTISGNEIIYKKLPVDDLKEAYRTTPFILLEKTDDGGTFWAEIDPSVIYGTQTFEVTNWDIIFE